MINEISNKVTSLDFSRKSENKKSDHESPAKPDLQKRSDLKQDDAIEISGQKPIGLPDEKTINPVSGQENDLHLLSDVRHKEANENGHIYPDQKETDKGNNGVNDEVKLSDEERKAVVELQKRDNEVRQHEYAHIAAAGAYSNGVSFTYQSGPDGQRYAVSGEVSIDTSPVHDNPDATIAKARIIRAAANAPADHSAQDRQVAAAATRMEAAARAEKMQEAAGVVEEENVSAEKTDINTEVNEADDPTTDLNAKEESLPVDSLTSAYGKKETEVGKVIRTTA